MPSSPIKQVEQVNNLELAESVTPKKNKVRIFLSNAIYLPFAYLEKVKRRGENYTLKVILWDDVPLLLLAFSWQATNSVLHGVSIIFLLVSFWCVYELGYYENDYVAEKYESKPKLALTYYAHKSMMRTAYPWLWSLVFGLIGIILLEKTQVIHLPFAILIAQKINFFNPIILTYLSWIIFLVCMRYCFFVYNYANKQTRIWLYIILQSFRYYSFLWVTATNLIGITLLSSQILSRSLLYLVYRYSGGDSNDWPREIPEKVLRCLIFIFMLTSICFGSQSLELWQRWQTWTIIAWCVIQGQGQIKRILLQVKLVAQDGSN
ncbi:hypothetical protein C7B62_11030 [Pleurocapsa sp. CCALA 161]|uniref:hypothetical protein n=1 Tax=Pleurocapsa sp. CCALA 161 TaxID=2107688 RepID=UPI000D05335A|nr:hypothetical protein [Pleurocapsa sp. CCALA 161]PSB10043.1 hypothetical protein C7B62_11030 [Pleurocapsa sp. CCALA 161]